MAKFWGFTGRLQMVELRCPHDLAQWLGAIQPHDVQHHRALKAGAASMVVRDPVTLQVMFWPLVSGSDITVASS